MSLAASFDVSQHLIALHYLPRTWRQHTHFRKSSLHSECSIASLTDDRSRNIESQPSLHFAHSLSFSAHARHSPQIARSLASPTYGPWWRNLYWIWCATDLDGTLMLKGRDERERDYSLWLEEGKKWVGRELLKSETQKSDYSDNKWECTVIEEGKKWEKW